MLSPDRFFSPDPTVRGIARRLFAEVSGLPLVCPHGHTEPAWFADDEPFADPAKLLVVPDHYILRMLVSQGIAHSDLGVPARDGTPSVTDGRKIWRRFAENYHLFRSTPVRHWMDFTLETLFGIEGPLNGAMADRTYDEIAAALATPQFRPRALYDRFNIETISTTDSCLDDLRHHKKIAGDPWKGRVLPTYRPDHVTNPDAPDFEDNLARLGDITGEDVGTWSGLLAAHRRRRQDFIGLGATATDHGHPSARTADLDASECQQLLTRVVSGTSSAEDRELFRAQMLTEMARISIDDGLVMQLHPGSRRNHSADIFLRFGADMGFDVPGPTDYVDALRPLLDAHGLDQRLTLVLFTLDETAYGRELAPLAGAYPCLRLGPAWWFFDSPDGMLRYRELTTETAGYYNTVGFNDDTRAFPSIPARHDMARRIDCRFLADQVAQHRLAEDEAMELAVELAYHLPRRTYRYEASS